MVKKQYSTKEIAALLGISRIAVFKKIKSGEIKAHKVGRNFVIDEENVANIISATLTENRKNEIKRSVDKTVAEYGEALKLLGKE
ncbi:MAG: excisionase family DNA-binding protein [Candidatus Paceibacterota bacterium]